MANKLVMGAIAAFVAVDVVLVVAAMRHVSGEPPPGGDAISAPTSAKNPTTQPTQSQPPDSPTPSQPSQSGSPVAEAGSEGLLSIGIDGTILRATSGDCRTDETGEVEVSTDEGASFRTVFSDVPEVLRVMAVSRSELWFVSADDACQPSVERSGDTGRSWVHSDGTAGAYHPSLSDNASLLHAPDGAVRVGCAAVGFAALDPEVAFVGCADGAIRRTLDRGQTWVPRGQVSGVVSLTFRDAETGFALAAQIGCPATAVTTKDSGNTWTFTECLDGATPEAIATNADRLVAQVDGDILVSDDDGQSWVPAG